MFEIEMKFAVADFSSVVDRLRGWQTETLAPIEEADHYFNAPDRDFARTDEAFRLRRIGESNRITYKGPKQPGPTKTRTEIEIALESGAEVAEKWCELVRCLGYRATAVVRKRRTIHEFSRGGFAMQVCCDAVESLGNYVEIEIIADAAGKQRAQDVLLQTAQELGLTTPEPRSYLEMVLAHAAKTDP